MSFVINLYCGATFVATSSELAYASEGDWVEGSHVLAAAERALITDWTDLRVNMIASFVGDLATVTMTVRGSALRMPRLRQRFQADRRSFSSNHGISVHREPRNRSDHAAFHSRNDPLSPAGRAVPGNTANTSALRWYSVDGDKSKRILYQGITVAPTVTDWAAEANLQAGSTVFPTGCRLVDAFLGAHVPGGKKGRTPTMDSGIAAPAAIRSTSSSEPMTSCRRKTLQSRGPTP